MPKLRKIGVGIYKDDSTNTLHFDIPEVLAWANWPDTSENRDLATSLVQRAVRKLFGDEIPQTVTTAADQARNN